MACPGHVGCPGKFETMGAICHIWSSFFLCRQFDVLSDNSGSCLDTYLMMYVLFYLVFCFGWIARITVRLKRFQDFAQQFDCPMIECYFLYVTGISSGRNAL
jgi:hypothetical protein